MTTGFFMDERCFWHAGGNYAFTMPVGGLVQPLAAGGLPENPETKRRLRNLMEVTGLMAELDLRSAAPASRDDLLRVHPAAYLDDFKRLSDAGGGELGLRTPFAAGGFEIAALSAGTMNILPWGGPTIRAATALEVNVTELFNPLLIPVIGGLLTVLVIAYLLGRKEKKFKTSQVEIEVQNEQPNTDLERPKLYYFNIALVLMAVATLISGIAPPHLIFMVAFAISLMINYPNPKDQGERINAHAKAALLMASILFAAGCFTGILKGSGMINAMAEGAVAYIPDSIGNHLAVITGVLSMPASLLFDPDSFYFGILPLLSTTASHFDMDAIEVGRAAIMGQMTTGFPVSPLTGSTYLLIGLTGIELGDHQKKTIPLAFLVTIVILVLSLFIGAISW